MDSKVAGRVVQVLLMRLFVAILAIGGTIYFYNHPDALSNAGHSLADHYLPPMATMPDVNSTPKPAFHR